METNSIWKIIYETNMETDARIIEGYLKTRGVQVVIKSDESLIYAGAGTIVSNYQLWVHHSQFVKARNLLEARSK